MSDCQNFFLFEVNTEIIFVPFNLVFQLNFKNLYYRPMGMVELFDEV